MDLQRTLAKNSATINIFRPIMIVTCLKLKVKQMRETEYCIDTVLVVQAKQGASEWGLLIRWQIPYFALGEAGLRQTLDPISSLALINYLHHLGNSNNICIDSQFFLFFNNWGEVVVVEGWSLPRNIYTFKLSMQLIFSFQWAKSFSKTLLFRRNIK